MVWTQEYQYFVERDRPGVGSSEKNCCWCPMFRQPDSLWRWLPLRLSKRQPPTTVLFRTTLTRTITFYECVTTYRKVWVCGCLAVCTVKSFYKIRHRINSLLQRGKVLKTVKYAAKKIPVRCKQVALKGAYTCGNWKEILGVSLCLTF